MLVPSPMKYLKNVGFCSGMEVAPLQRLSRILQDNGSDLLEHKLMCRRRLTIEVDSTVYNAFGESVTIYHLQYAESYLFVRRGLTLRAQIPENQRCV